MSQSSNTNVLLTITKYGAASMVNLPVKKGKKYKIIIDYYRNKIKILFEHFNYIFIKLFVYNNKWIF